MIYKRMFTPSCLLLLSAFVLAGCVTVPDSIKGTSAKPQQDLLRVNSAPQLYVGQEARFGGKVISVMNDTDRTRLEMVVQPLDESARPVLTAAFVGRIYADINGFVDPASLNNQMVTVIGTIKGTEQGRIGQAQYRYVVVNVTGYQHWHLTQRIVMPPQPPGYWGWFGPRYGRRGGVWRTDPWGGGFNNAPAEVQTILTE